MLGIYVDLCRAEGSGDIGSGETAELKVGDIPFAKVEPADWSWYERTYQLLAYLNWPEVEAKAIEGLIDAPFALTDEEGTIINRSAYRVDLSMFAGSPGLDKHQTLDQPAKPNGKDYLVPDDLIYDPSPRL